MNGDPAMILPAILAVLASARWSAYSTGSIVAKLEVNPLIATLGMSLIIQGCLSAFVSNFAGSVPPEFQFFAYGSLLGLPFSLLLLIALALCAGSCCASPDSAPTSIRSAAAAMPPASPASRPPA